MAKHVINMAKLMSIGGDPLAILFLRPLLLPISMCRFGARTMPLIVLPHTGAHGKVSDQQLLRATRFYRCLPLYQNQVK